MNFIIKTNHLILRPFSDRDATALSKITADTPIFRWIPGLHRDQDPETIRKQMLNFMAQYEAATKHKAEILFSVTLGREKFIGMVAVSAKKEVANEFEIAYFMAQTYTLQGYTSEAVEAVSKWAKDGLALDCGIAIVDTGVHLFQQVAGKSGFVHVDTRMFKNLDQMGNGAFFHHRFGLDRKKTG